MIGMTKDGRLYLKDVMNHESDKQIAIPKVEAFTSNYLSGPDLAYKLEYDKQKRQMLGAAKAAQSKARRNKARIERMGHEAVRREIDQQEKAIAINQKRAANLPLVTHFLRQKARAAMGSADFTEYEINNPPITRRGPFGPTPDWPGIVDGIPFNESVYVPGDLMRRSLNTKQADFHDNLGRMGDEFSDFEAMPADGSTDSGGGFWSDLWSNVQEQVTEQAPQALVQAGITAAIPKPTSTTTVITRPTGTSAPASSIFSSSTMPKWVIPTALGLGVLGVGLIAFKTFKK